ncbi:hypothetical protein RJ641_010393 [Dillenia turbinata]|uniref:Alginate lyase 2 domain-containing protein n=1 Tax=Dillenia turbinata TaxID=194707 RepID=A0AAN8VAH8_9MAGN
MGCTSLGVYSDNPYAPTSITEPRTQIRIKIVCYQASAQTDPTKGFNEQPLDQSYFEIQKPYDMPVDQRYSFVDGVHKLWVYSTDKPDTPTSYTVPGTEIRIREWRTSNIYDRWFKLNVIHDVGASKVKIYIDGVLKYEAPGYGGDSHYFKCGVHAQNNASYHMESRWKNIRILKK